MDVDLSPAGSTGVGTIHTETVPSASPDPISPGRYQATEVTGCVCGSVAVSARVARFHTSTLASDVPAARDRPSGLNATVLAQFVAPVSAPSGLARPPPSFHSHTFMSWLAAASIRPSGLNATPETKEAGPVSGVPGSGTWRAGLATFHSKTVPPAVPAASVLPSGLNAIDSTSELTPGPVSGRPSGSARAGSVTSQRRTVPSAPPAA